MFQRKRFRDRTVADAAVSDWCSALHSCQTFLNKNFDTQRFPKLFTQFSLDLILARGPQDICRKCGIREANYYYPNFSF